MNKVFISGMIVEKPTLRMEQGEIPHLILGLSVRHKVQNGEFRKETYRVSAWHNTAKWGAENLNKGQIIGVQGYLTQRQIHADAVTAVATEIAVDEFLPMRQTLREDNSDSAGIALAEAVCE